MELKFIASSSEKEMANGMRNLERTPLTDEEIEWLKGEIRAIEADESVFEFNDPEHIKESTCYNYEKDKVFVTRNVFPSKYYSTHPRDNLSPRAVLAHEYYGHRAERERYFEEERTKKKMPEWQDEAYASINAAYNTPNLSQHDRALLINEGRHRANQFGHEIDLTDDMMEMLYGKYEEDDAKEKGIVNARDFVKFTVNPGEEGNQGKREDDRKHGNKRTLPRMRP